MERLLVTGATGLLGSEVCAAARRRSWTVVAPGRDRLDVTVPDGDTDAASGRRSAHAPEGAPAGVAAAVAQARPSLVIHCAAYTSVDEAEGEPELAMSVNRDGARHVAIAARDAGARFVYLSTDYVFDGALRRPYRPEDEPRPLSAYGRSKLAGETATLEASPDALVARASWLFGAAREGFLTTMLDRAVRGQPLTVVDDQVGGPSWAHDVAEALLDLVDTGARGVWHVANRGGCSRAELVREALRLRDLDAPVTGVSADRFGAPARRPSYSVLDVSATEARLGRDLPSWDDALARFLGSLVPTGVQ